MTSLERRPIRTVAAVDRAVAAVAAGTAIVLVDDVRRAGEADLMVAADWATTELMAFFVRHTSGFICVAVDEATCDRLRLPAMAHVSPDECGPAYTVTVDAAAGVTTGISAQDRAHTARVLADPAAQWTDLDRPGHIQPLRTHAGGVTAWAGYAEAAVDLALLAGSSPAAVLCGVVSPRDPQQMAHGQEACDFARRHGLPSVTVSAVRDYLRATNR